MISALSSNRGDHTQTGHILGDPNRRDNADMLDTKGISPVPFTTIRMFTHMAMLLGAGSHLQVVVCQFFVYFCVVKLQEKLAVRKEMLKKKKYNTLVLWDFLEHLL